MTFDFTAEARRRHAPGECGTCGYPRFRAEHADWCARVRSALATSASPPPSAMETGGADITTSELAQPRSPGEGEPPHPVAVKAPRPDVATLPVESTSPSRSAPHQDAPSGASTGMPYTRTTPRDASQAPPEGP